MLKNILEYIAVQGPYIVTMAVIITYGVYQLLAAVAESY
jgi:hypothetical protein